MQDSLPGFLTAENNIGYGRARIPSPRDEEIATYLEDALRSGRCRSLGPKVDLSHRQVLRAFAERMATQALRRRDCQALRVGLVALCLGAAELREHEDVLVLPLLFAAAASLNVDAASLMEAIDRECGPEQRRWIERFLARAPEDRTPEVMGFRLGSDADGPRFVQDI